MVYILSRAFTVAAGTTKKALHEGEAVGVRIEKSDESLVLTPEGHVHLLLLSGEDPNEPVVAYGPFIINTQEEQRPLTATAPARWAGWKLFTFLPDAKFQKNHQP